MDDILALSSPHEGIFDPLFDGILEDNTSNFYSDGLSSGPSSPGSSYRESSSSDFGDMSDLLEELDNNNLKPGIHEVMDLKQGDMSGPLCDKRGLANDFENIPGIIVLGEPGIPEMVEMKPIEDVCDKKPISGIVVLNNIIPGIVVCDNLSENALVSPLNTKSEPLSHCGVCKLVFARKSLLSEHNESFAKSLTCCHCGKGFSSKFQLITHQRKHSKEKPFECTNCGKCYARKTTLSRHQLHYCTTTRGKVEDGFESDILEEALCRMTGQSNSLESDFEPIDRLKEDIVKPAKSKCEATKCKVCDKEFFDVTSLKNHSDYHLQNKSCCHCGKILGNKSKLLTHHRTHTKEHPYSCTFCGKKFAENSTLRKHEATHGAKNFQCQICDRGFVRKDYLAKHLLTHRQTYKCSDCAFVCYSKEDIQKHVLLHKS